MYHVSLGAYKRVFPGLLLVSLVECGMVRLRILDRSYSVNITSVYCIASRVTIVISFGAVRWHRPHRRPPGPSRAPRLRQLPKQLRSSLQDLHLEAHTRSARTRQLVGQEQNRNRSKTIDEKAANEGR